MNVLYYIDSLGRGGAEMLALDVCRNAARFGIEMTFVTARGGQLETAFIDSGVPFFRLGRRLPVDLYLASQIRRLIREREIDIVHGYQAVDGIHMYLASRGVKNVKNVLSFHGFVPDRKNRAALKFLIPRMDTNLVVSHSLRRWLSDLKGLDTESNFSTLYNGVDLGRLKPSGRSVREELGIDQNALVFGMIANFYSDPRKDQLTICKALPQVFEKLPHAHFLFVGGIENGAEDKVADCISFCLQSKISERVHFLGSRLDIPDVLDAMNIFVLSSLQEGLPIAVNEAMLVGLPVIVSDIEPLLEATQNGVYGMVFPVGDHWKLAELMIDLGMSSDEQSVLGLRAKEFAKQKFSIDAHLHELRKIYISLL